jgi:hypothetical protein
LPAWPAVQREAQTGKKKKNEEVSDYSVTSYAIKNSMEGLIS